MSEDEFPCTQPTPESTQGTMADLQASLPPWRSLSTPHLGFSLLVGASGNKGMMAALGLALPCVFNMTFKDAIYCRPIYLDNNDTLQKNDLFYLRFGWWAMDPDDADLTEPTQVFIYAVNLAGIDKMEATFGKDFLAPGKTMIVSRDLFRLDREHCIPHEEMLVSTTAHDIEEVMASGMVGRRGDASRQRMKKSHVVLLALLWFVTDELLQNDLRCLAMFLHNV